MTDTVISPPSEEAYLPVQTCRNLHRTWATVLGQNEGEIDQLLTMLAELPNESYRSLQPYTVDYAQVLDQLKVRIHRLRTEVVCSGAGCSSPTPPAACPDPRFVSPMVSSSLISGVSAEYSRAKERCDAFLGGLMRLNLI